MYLCSSVLSFWSQLTNVACLICLMPYLYPSERTSFFFFPWIHFPSFAFSFLCSLDFSPSGFLISSFMSLHIFGFLSYSHSGPHLSFLVLGLSFLKPSPMRLDFLFGEGSCCLSPPPTCHVQSFH